MRPTFLHVTLLAVYALAVAGCATIQANITETAKRQAMADRVTDGHITVVLTAGRTGQYLRLSRTVELGMANSEEGKQWLLAHELGHYVLGHVGLDLRQEMEANASAVRSLQAWGRSERDAVALVESILLRIQRNGSTLTGKGHDWCAEYHDVTRRYPQYPAPAGAEVCAG